MLVSITVAAVVVAQDWRHAHVRSAVPLVLSTLIGEGGIRGLDQNLFRVAGICYGRVITGCCAGSVPCVGCGDVRLLSERERSTAREATRGPHQLDSAVSSKGVSRRRIATSGMLAGSTGPEPAASGPGKSDFRSQRLLPAIPILPQSRKQRHKTRVTFQRGEPLIR